MVISLYNVVGDAALFFSMKNFALDCKLGNENFHLRLPTDSAIFYALPEID